MLESAFFPVRFAVMLVGAALATVPTASTVRSNEPVEGSAGRLVQSRSDGRVGHSRIVGQLIGEKTLASNVVAIRRRLAREPAESQFEMLCRWVLPGQDHATYRLTGLFVPTEPAPAVLADAAFRSAPVDGTSPKRTSRQSLISPVFDLLEVAVREDRLAELRRRIEKAEPAADPEQAMSKAALLALVNLYLGQPAAAAPLITKLRKSIPELKAADLQELWPVTLVAYSCACDFPSSPGGQDLVTALYESHVQPVSSPAPKSWQSQILGLVSEIRLRQWKESGGRAVRSPPFPMWIPTTASRANTRGPGGASARWIKSPQGFVGMLGGHNFDFLGFQSPLRGNYTIEVDVAANATTQVLHAGDYAGPGNPPTCFVLGKLGMKHRFVPLETPFGKTQQWVRYRVKVRDNTEQLFLNGRQVRRRTLPAGYDPWFAIRGWYKSNAQFQDIRIGGSPTIPDSVRLDASTDLCGWLAYFSESVGTPESPWRRTDHHAGEGVLQGMRLEHIGSSYCQRLLRYHRPIVEDGSIEFEFYYEPDLALTSPAVDRLAFVFTSSGVAEHWVTDGRFDVTEIRPDNLQRYDSFQRGNRSLPLESDAWNHVELRFSGATLSIFLNGLLVYQRPLDSKMNRIFGLFHFADQHEVVARNIIMRGQWPRELPASQPLQNPRPKVLDSGLLDASVFAHDFRSQHRLTKFFKVLTAGSNANVTPVSDGVRMTVASSGAWTSGALSPSFSLFGDFDVVASFSSLDVSEPKSGQVQMTLQLTDPYQRKLVSGIGQDEWNGPSVRGQVMLTNADGTKRFVNTNLADESKSGRLRIARRGDQFYALYAQGDSPHWRVVEQETVSTGAIDFGGIQLVTIADGRGRAGVVWNDLTLRAEKLLFKTPESQFPARILSIFRVDGSERRDLTPADNPMKVLGSPVWSPDGKWIAYQQFPTDVRDSRIMIVNTGGGAAIDLGPGNMPDFSADGKQIVYSNSRVEMGIMNADGSNRRSLHRRGSGPVWKPGSEQLTYSSGRNLIVLSDLDDENPRDLLPTEVASRYQSLYWNLAWSPRGRRIAFNGRNRQTREIELAMISLDQPEKVRVLYSGFDYPHVDHCWSPSGDQILVPIERPGSIGRQLFLLDPQGVQGPRRLPGGPADRIVFGADWSPDGQWIAITAQPVITPKAWRHVETAAQPGAR